MAEQTIVAGISNRGRNNNPEGRNQYSSGWMSIGAREPAGRRRGSRRRGRRRACSCGRGATRSATRSAICRTRSANGATACGPAPTSPASEDSGEDSFIASPRRRSTGTKSQSRHRRGSADLKETGKATA